jgi:hypothetical protein
LGSDRILNSAPAQREKNIKNLILKNEGWNFKTIYSRLTSVRKMTKQDCGKRKKIIIL